MKLTVFTLLCLVLVLTCLLAAAPPDPPKAAPVPPVDKVLTNSIGMKLSLIPAGKFLMGSPETEPERDPEEVPHEVTITRPFYMGVYPVTQAEFARIMGGGIRPGAFFNARQGGGPDHPMENVLWKHAVEFCRKLSGLSSEAGRRYRLPTEAEWEYACRAGTTTAFHFGNALSSQQANFNGRFPYGGAEKGPYLRRTAKVGSYPPNAFGLYDMHGNVWQWCADWYDKDYYRHSPKADPLGPAQGVMKTDYNDYYRVVRGGSWLDEARACRSARRFRAMPSDTYRIIGFRVVCEAPVKMP
jgi:formylglycine-generating enzyme required for sulfatase activity